MDLAFKHLPGHIRQALGSVSSMTKSSDNNNLKPMLAQAVCIKSSVACCVTLVTVPMRISCRHVFVVGCLHEISLQSVKESFSVLPANAQIVTQRVLIS